MATTLAIASQNGHPQNLHPLKSCAAKLGMDADNNCCASAAPSPTTEAAHIADLKWLVRYSRHCGHRESEDDGEQLSIDVELASLRCAFGPSAWRIVCKSPRSSFLPILRNQELNLQSLITYCQRLAKRSFELAPHPALLGFFINQRRLFCDQPCRVPEDQDYIFIRLANKHLSSLGPDNPTLRVRDIARVVNWAHQTRTTIKTSHQWKSLLERASKHFEGDRIELASQRQSPWHFYCAGTAWRGHQITPLTNPFRLWLQGQHQGNCLYKLRFECASSKPSRFFDISRCGKSIATLELVWRAPQDHFKGMDRLWGRWELQDLRLSYNRQPDAQLLASMNAFATMYNTWSKRLRRQPTGSQIKPATH